MWHFWLGRCLRFYSPFGRFYEKLKDKSSLSLSLSLVSIFISGVSNGRFRTCFYCSPLCFSNFVIANFLLFSLCIISCPFKKKILVVPLKIGVCEDFLFFSKFYNNKICTNHKFIQNLQRLKVVKINIKKKNHITYPYYFC